jgi:hypothetical protein
MGELLTASGPAPRLPRRRSRGWIAAVPFALAWSFAALTLGEQLAPATLDESQPRLEESPPAPSPPATHHDDIDFDSSELISV